VIVLAVIAISVYFIVQQQQAASAEAVLSASGTIEAQDVIVSPELAGKVVEVLVDEGDSVQAGDLLFRLDDSLLQAQLRAAQAGLETARASQAAAQAALDSAKIQYDLALIAAQVEEQAIRTSDWKGAVPAEFDQPNWYFDREEKIQAAQAEVSAAEEALAQTQTELKFVEEKATSAGFLAAEQTLAQARLAYQVAKDVFDLTSGVSGQELRDSAQTALDEAEADLNDAQTAYDDALTTEGADDVLTARADLAITRERLDSVRDRLRAMQVGIYSPKLAAAESLVKQAEAAVNQAGQAIRQAEAQVALIETQVQKTSVHAPVDGMVSVRSIQPGEVVQPGSAVLTLIQPDDLTLTVYVPEDRYGEINLGQSVTFTVDSFPGETFTATVTRIADRAEFTPRNVQTVEGRSSTVYAIQLSVDNLAGKLKPGMPADVIFSGQ
jgi:multidrug resistance efflux pump